MSGWIIIVGGGLLTGFLFSRILKALRFPVWIYYVLGLLSPFVGFLLFEAFEKIVGIDYVENMYGQMTAGVVLVLILSLILAALLKRSSSNAGTNPSAIPASNLSASNFQEEVSIDRLQLRSLIENGETKKALELLKNNDSTASMLLSEYNSKRRDYLANVINQEEWSRTQARINQAIIEIIS